MTPERWAQVRRIFENALEREPEYRTSFVAEFCAGDEELQREVASLLAHDASDDSIIDGPVWAPAWPATLTQLGHYRIIGVLGEGGMGTVYEAEQENPRRTVALKVIQPGRANAESMRRFEQEARALGRLQHPGIAQIYEAGAADTGLGPQAFFAMELIRGETLRKHAETNGLSTRQRLELTAKICDAVDHAHQRGLIHRDLKPANILVDQTGQPKILDFGVARFADSDPLVTQKTGLGQLVGTLAYMSPEQVLADPLELDTRTDVYSLGVILYELLSGQRPYEISTKLHEAAQTIREKEPAPLGSMNRLYRGDIETIVSKALEKDKNRRYGSAVALADDIRRHLKNEPVMARPPRATYQLKKFARRHMALVGGLAAVFIVLLAGVVASTWEARRANKAEQGALAEAATAKAVVDFLQNDLLSQASADTQAAPGIKPDPNLTVRTALDRAAARISGKFSKQPLVEASIRQTISNTYYELGLYREAQTQAEGALTLRGRVLGEQHPDTLSSMVASAGLHADLGDDAKAESLYTRALDMQRRVLGEGHTETQANMNNLALLYLDEGKYTQAEPLFSRVLEIRRRALGDEHPDTLISMNNLALLYRHQGKYMQAEPLYIKALEARRRVLGEEHPGTLITMSNLAWLYMSEGKYPAAEPLLYKVLEVRRRVLGEQHPDTLISMDGLANVYTDEGKYAQAEPLYTKAVDSWRRVSGESRRDTLVSMMSLAGLYAKVGNYGRAEGLYIKVLEAQRRVLGDEHPDALSAMSGLAVLYKKKGNYVEAERLAAKVLEARRRVLGPRHPSTTSSMALLGEVWLQQKKYSAAEPILREALIIQKESNPDNWNRFYSESLLGVSLTGQGKYAEAEQPLVSGCQGMVERKTTIPVSSRSALQECGGSLVHLYEQWGKVLEAAKWRAKIPALQE